MLFISPPFGNYINLPNTISIRGSFTLKERPGKWAQILKTLRYIPYLNGWVNKIGLRNPGIDYAIRTYKKGEIISIAILEKEEIPLLVEKIPDDMDIELNVSCPNTDKHMVNKGLKPFINSKRRWCIIKLSPVEEFENVRMFYDQGFRQFHCCNTLPVKQGGLSGPSVKGYSLFMIQHFHKYYRNKCEIIGGGGIRTLKDVKDYKEAGADHVSVSSLFFNPFMFGKFYSEWNYFE